MEKTIGYVRVSSEEQKKSGLSVTDQEQKIKDYAKFKGINNIEIVKDEAESGKNLLRTGWVEIEDDIERGLISSVIVYKLDRLTRNIKDLGYLMELFEKRNVKFVSLTENIDTTTASGKLIVNMLGSVAQWEREIIAERTKSALAVKRDRHELIGSVPYGYKKFGTNRINSKGKVIMGLEPIPNEQKTIKKILRLHKDGETTVQISNYLNQMKVLSKKGGKWYPSSVGNMIEKHITPLTPL